MDHQRALEKVTFSEMLYKQAAINNTAKDK